MALLRVPAVLLSCLALVVGASAATAVAEASVLVASSPLAERTTGEAPVAFDGQGHATTTFTTVASDGTGAFTGAANWTATRPFGATQFEAPRALVPEHPLTAPAQPAAPVLAVDAAGNATIAWLESPTQHSRELWIAERAAGAADFAAATRLVDTADVVMQFAVARGDDGTTTLVWLAGRDWSEASGYTATVRARVRAGGAGGYGPAADLSQPGPIRRFDLSTEPAGGAAVAWLWVRGDAQSPAVAGTVDAHVARKAPGSAAFGAPVQVSSPTERVTDRAVRVAQAPANETTVLWTVAEPSEGAPGNEQAVAVSRTLTAGGTLADRCALRGPDGLAWASSIAAAASDAAGHVVAIGGHGDRLAAATKRPGQPCFETAEVTAPGLTAPSSAKLAADGRGGLFLMTTGPAGDTAPGRQLAYRAPLGDAAAAGFTSIDGFHAGAPAALAADRFGHAAVTFGNRSGQLGTAVIDRAPPTMTTVDQADGWVAGKPLTMRVGVTDAYSSPVAVEWAFSDGTKASGAAATRTFRAGETPSAVVTATDAVGNIARQTVVIRPDPVTVPPKDWKPRDPVLFLNLERTKFRIAAGKPGALDRQPVKKGAGAALSVATSTAGSARFVLTRDTAGRRVGARCQPGAPTKQRPTRCRVMVAVKSVVTRDVPGGRSTLRITGRWNGAALAPGRYRLEGKLTAGGQSSEPDAVTFRITG